MNDNPRSHSVWEYSLTRKRALEVGERERADGPADIARILRAIGLQHEEQEHFLTIMLGARNHVRGFYTVTIGLVDRASVHCREAFRCAVLAGATKVIVAHNHPTGDITPSELDITCTRELVAAGKIIGIEVVDHVIIGLPTASRPRDYLSFREENLL